MTARRRRLLARRRCSPSCAGTTSSCSSRTSAPTATRSARSRRCSACSPRSARTPSPSSPPTSSRCPTSTASSRSTAWSPSRPADLDERALVFLDCGNIDRTPADVLKRDGAHILNIDHHHDNTRFGTFNHVDARRLVHGRDGLGPDARAGRAAHAGDRRGALRRPGHRHGQLHVREHRSARAPDGGRADRGRRRRPRRSTGASTRACRRASSSCSRAASAPSSATTAACSRSRTSRARTTAHRRRRELLRGRRRPPALGRGHRRRGAGARPAERPAAAKRKVSLRATDDRVDVSRIARASGGGGHRRAAGFSTDLEFAELVEFLRARARPTQLVADRATASSSSTSPPGSPPTTWSPQQRRRLGRGVKVGHAGTLDPFATGLLLVLVGRATRVQRFLMALPKRYEVRGAAGLDLDHRRPRGGDRAPGRMPPEPLVLPTGRAAPAPARLLARSRSAASAPTRSPAAARPSSCPSAR